MTDKEQLKLLPETPPEPTSEGFENLDVILGALSYWMPGKKPDAAFLRSVEVWGIRDPIILGKEGEDAGFGKPGSLKLIDGRRRLQSAITLEIELVPYRIYDLSDISDAALAIDSNVQRSSNPIAEHQAILNFIASCTRKGYTPTEKEIASVTGMRVQTIRKRMKLSKVPTAVYGAVEQKKVSVSVAESISKLPKSRQDELVDILDETGKITGDDLKSVKQVIKHDALDAIGEVFDMPVFDPQHKHQFEIYGVPDQGWRCRCGRTISIEEAEIVLNTFVD